MLAAPTKKCVKVVGAICLPLNSPAAIRCVSGIVVKAARLGANVTIGWHVRFLLRVLLSLSSWFTRAATSMSWRGRTTKRAARMTPVVKARSSRSERQLRFFRLAFVVLPDVDVELRQHVELAFVEDGFVGAHPFLEGLQDLEPPSQLVEGERGDGFLRLDAEDALGHEQPLPLLDCGRSGPEQVERGLDLFGAEIAALPPLVELGLPVIGDQVGARCPGL